MIRLRVYSEMLPWDELLRPRTVALLASRRLALVLAVRPWELAEMPRVARGLKDAGVPLAIWPMLADGDGRWANARNAPRFAALVRAALAVFDEPAARELRPDEILFDLEPSFADARALSPGTGGAGLRALARSAPSPRVVREGAAVLRDAANEARDRGYAIASAVWPLVALDGGGRGFQSLLGTPADAVPASRVSVMIYTSMLEGWSRGALRRRDASLLLEAGAARVVARWGDRGALSLGCVGTGAFEDEPVYRSPAELAEDVAIATRAGCTDLSLFDLAGVLARPPPEAWLDALAVAPDARDTSDADGRSLRVEVARRLGRAASSVARSLDRAFFTFP